MSIKTKAVLAVILSALFGGAVGSATKIGLLNIPPLSFSFIRFFIASLCILPFFLIEKPRFDRTFIKMALISTLPTINVGLFVFGVRLTTASISQMLYSATTLLSAVFAFIIIKEKVSLKKWLFIILGLAGTLITLLLPLIETGSPFKGNLFGNILIFTGVIFWSMYLVLSKSLHKKYSPTVITSMFFFVSAVIFFFFFVIDLKNSSDWLYQINFSSVISLLYVALGATVATYFLIQYSIKLGGPIIASLTFYLMPIFAYFWAFILLGEKLTIGLVSGTLVVFLSVILINYFSS